jgi:glutamate dehydrogenase
MMMKDVLTQLGYPKDMYELLKEPLKVLKVRIPVKMDDDTVQIFTAYRSQHHDVFGITQGNVHFRPDLTEEEIAALSILRSVKASNLQLPIGGSSGGIICDPRKLSYRELERLSRGYIRAIHHNIGPHIDIPSSDASLDAQIIAWMMDEYSRLHCEVDPNFISGKPYILGGLKYKESAIEQGIFHTLCAMIDEYHLNVKETKVIIHGSGAIASYIANKLYQIGVKVIGISDPQKAIYDEEGINIPDLFKHKDNFGIFNYDKDKSISLEEFWFIPNDFVVLTTKHEQVDIDLAQKLHTRFILETVNHTLTKDAIQLLHEKDVIMIPEVLTTNGGIVYAYLEWLEYKQGKRFSEKEIETLFNEIIQNALQLAKRTSVKFKVNMYTSSYMIGLKNQAEAIRYRGWI